MKIKKLSSLLVCALLMFTLLPVTALAAPADVDTYAEFTAAVADASVETINVTGSFVLEGNVTVARSVTLTSAAGAVISAGGNSITVSGSVDLTMNGNLTVTGTGVVADVNSFGEIYFGGNAAIQATGTGAVGVRLNGNDSGLTMTGGIITATGDASYGVYITNSYLNINGGSVTVSGAGSIGIYAQVNNGSMTYILKGTVSASGAGARTVVVSGDVDLTVKLADSDVGSVYYRDGAADRLFLGEVSVPIPAVQGEENTVTFETDNVAFTVDTYSTDASLNASASGNTVTLLPTAIGTFDLEVEGTAGGSLIEVIAPVAVTNGFAGGDGTSAHPYEIATAAQLNKVRYFLGDANTNLYFKLVADINLDVAPYNTGAGWEPLGTSANQFTANLFDGNGHTISGLYINRPGMGHVGLFGFTGSGEIKDVTLEGVDATGGSYAGGLVAFNYDTVTDCAVSGKVTAASDGGYAGGLVGFTYGANITGSSSACAVYATGDSGIAGGLVGENYNATVSNCFTTGDVEGSACVGGLAGYVFTGSIANSYAIGDVEGTTNVGGLLGENYHSTVINSYATGSVTGSGGGLIGSSSGGSITSSYYNTQTSGRSDTGNGEPRTTAQMIQKGTFSAWDFDTIWAIDTNTYPYLRNNIPAPKPAPMAAPAAPTLAGRTDTSVTLTANSSLEFRVNSGAWQDSNMFTGLSPATSYVFTSRVKETSDHAGSPESAALTVTTYTPPYALSYNLDGGTVSPANPSIYYTEGPDLTLNNPVKEGYTFAGWSGTGIAGMSVSVTIPSGSAGDRAYTARWTPLLGFNSSVTDGVIYIGGRITLTPNIAGGSWDWDRTFFSATFNSPATFTALKAGASTITYTAEGQTVSYNVTIKNAVLPSTGQDFTTVWVLGIAAIAVSGSACLALRKHNRRI